MITLFMMLNQDFTCSVCGKEYKDSEPNSGKQTCSRCGKFWKLCPECRAKYNRHCPSCGGATDDPWTHANGKPKDILY